MPATRMPASPGHRSPAPSNTQGRQAASSTGSGCRNPRKQGRTTTNILPADYLRLLRAGRCPGLMRISPVRVRKGRSPGVPSPAGKILDRWCRYRVPIRPRSFLGFPEGGELALFVRFGGRGRPCGPRSNLRGGGLHLEPSRWRTSANRERQCHQSHRDRHRLSFQGPALQSSDTPHRAFCIISKSRTQFRTQVTRQGDDIRPRDRGLYVQLDMPPAANTSV